MLVCGITIPSQLTRTLLDDIMWCLRFQKQEPRSMAERREENGYGKDEVCVIENVRMTRYRIEEG